MEELKREASHDAVKQVHEGMIVGLGTGSTARYAILKLGELVAAQNFDIVGIPTSKESDRLARTVGIPIGDINDYEFIDLTIDGADQINAEYTLIKGGGGALLREKIVANITKKEIIVVDEHKMVDYFSFPIPVEVVPFGWRRTADKLYELDLFPQLREGFITDNGNFILDCKYDLIDYPAELEESINTIVGVVENGLFIDLADQIVIGRKDGIEIREL